MKNSIKHNLSLCYSIIKDSKTEKWIGKLEINGIKYKVIGNTKQEVYNWIKNKIQKERLFFNLIKNPCSKDKVNMTKIYDDILSIEAQKGKDSLWPSEKFRHDFNLSKGKAKIYGLPDGSLLIKGNKRLWRNFNYK